MSQEGEGKDTARLSVRGLFLAGIRLAHNRLQILATEVSEEKVRLTLLGGGLLAMTVRSMSQKAPPFQVTMGELKKDRDVWRATENAP